MHTNANAPLELAVLQADDDFVMYVVSASNGRFTGAAEFYGTPAVVSKLADGLRGFPRSLDERRVVEIGVADLAFTMEGARLDLYCTDSTGHLAMDVVVGDCLGFGGSQQRASFQVRFEAAALDDFVADLDAMEVVDGSRAVMRWGW